MTNLKKRILESTIDHENKRPYFAGEDFLWLTMLLLSMGLAVYFFGT